MGFFSKYLRASVLTAFTLAGGASAQLGTFLPSMSDPLKNAGYYFNFSATVNPFPKWKSPDNMDGLQYVDYLLLPANNACYEITTRPAGTEYMDLKIWTNQTSQRTAISDDVAGDRYPKFVFFSSSLSGIGFRIRISTYSASSNNNDFQFGVRRISPTTESGCSASHPDWSFVKDYTVVRYIAY